MSACLVEVQLMLCCMASLNPNGGWLLPPEDHTPSGSFVSTKLAGCETSELNRRLNGDSAGQTVRRYGQHHLTGIAHAQQCVLAIGD
jgi:hypothetical protein